MSKYEIVTINNKLVSIDLSELLEAELLIPRGMDCGRVYIVLFKNNKVKIGKTKNIRTRIAQLSSQSGESFDKVILSDFFLNAGEVESNILAKCNRVTVNNSSITEYVTNSIDECIEFLHNQQVGIKIADRNELNYFIYNYRQNIPKFDFKWSEDEEPLYKELKLNNIQDQELYCLSWIEHSMIFKICFNESLNEFYIKHNLPDNCDFRTLCLLDFGIASKEILPYRELQKTNTVLINIGMDRPTRKLALQQQYHKLIQKLLS